MTKHEYIVWAKMFSNNSPELREKRLSNIRECADGVARFDPTAGDLFTKWRLAELALSDYLVARLEPRPQ